MATINTFRLPDLGEGLTEADLLSWSVAVGDQVTLNQIIAEVETAKALVELPSPYTGTVHTLHVPPGATVSVGAPLIDIETAGDTDVPPDKPPSRAETRTPVLVGYGVAEPPPRRRRTNTGSGPTLPHHGSPPKAPGRPMASPPVRFAARNNDVDLADVEPTGAQGEITRADLERFLQDRRGELTPPTTPIEPEPTRPGETRTPVTGVRKHTAEAMVHSAFTAPHVTIFVDVDITPTLELVDHLRGSGHFAGIRLTPLAMVARALTVALRTNPSLNATWDEPRHEIVTKNYVNLGIAAATPRGLTVPNIKNAHHLSLRAMAQALAELTALAREGKTPPADLTGGTITITNIGVFGIDSGTPILNPGEAAILCFGSIRRRPWEYQGQVCLRSVTTLSLAFDHRLADGEQGAKLLADVAGILADPTSLIALA
ncbi:dihydrolipoamide acetyltransferase family protein [Mycolicibacterium helvum]|uniref:Dihydrolipoamide acetyltransferase component of pyruvate dehydrogenase complex n=1 Tax=Mycolicibacterium helvum TaxID=1534349 RepID=A0A7I7T838_9MYCO|nr:dihydrolipoamide acetyltransferase family protein [Mycolicibacterium helvum]BBY64963.1 dihydrolipoamide acetyltransferase component of pyruvate dehydrogenase complex [Mycolicibacterium helvum]